MSKEYFRISSGLKNLIGSELITDNFVAVFELVKNSFDARASEVLITFEDINSDNAKIIIQDNGKGMDYDDLINKWLFVAYSAKRDGTEDILKKNKDLNYYAGAKGVGRFSCDRLGDFLNLITIKNEPKSKIENIFVDWRKFEKDQNKEFIKIPVEHKILEKTKYKIASGTILEISGINPDEWNRDSLIKLKDKLSKLVRPDLNKIKKEKPFKITLNVPDEKDTDLALIAKNKAKGEGFIYRNTVNGIIENFVFDELDIRTTKIITEISSNGEVVTTKLVDRENILYQIEEKNKFKFLSDITIQLYFLNFSAKNIFKRKIGVSAVNYGNLFVYKNGFRILPFGEPRDDSFGIDARALQGFSRYIGTRNLIGQVEIFGDNSNLRETTSRDGGLVKTKSYSQLIEYIFETLKRLEKYVVEVTQWGVNDDDFEKLNTKEIKEKLVKLISNIADDKTLLSLDYNSDIINLVSDQQEGSAKKLIKNFKRIASESNSPKLLKDAKRLEKTLTSALDAKKSAEKELATTVVEKNKIENELEQQLTENLFAKADRGTEKDDLLSIQHHIYRHSAQHITKYIDDLVTSINKDEPKDKLLGLISKISFENKKVITLSKFVTKAQFDTTITKIKADLITFINEYVINVYQEYKHLMMNHQNLKIQAERPKDFDFIFPFRPIEIIIILDNILNNSIKAKATEVKVNWKVVNQKEIELHIKDNGVGIDDNVKDKIFEPRFTTTNGSGLGLYHTKEVVEKLNGKITVNNEIDNGVEFIITFKK
ncbi:ATP-binding protein [Gelidibacter salicanalis]|uniref:histidine kinase n=1 Tax=Gelidibacter salicanalis TaxID=291193 RepID=A0A934NIU2_9FLAO|nr:ATP-binding protein [Gelidibacter salicanalis]MBJ7880499.1 ATP-binding protein [Gelidibacter salicanalis]